MDIISNLATGFGVALSPGNLLYCFFGVLLGTLIGILPGIGPIATIAMLLPATFALDPVSALIMLAGIYYGASYGGSTTAILVNLPGESSSVVACLDGYQMARRGQAGAALSIAAIGSFLAGCVGTLLLAATAPLLAQVAVSFGAAEYFSLMVFGLVAAVVLASGSVLKAVAMILLGLLFGTIGTDINSGVERFTFNLFELSSGISFVVVALGLFGITEILLNLEARGKREIMAGKVTGLWLKWAEFKQALPAILRGSALGSALGVLPGAGPTLAAFSSYTVEKRVAKDPSRFGKGAIEGLAGPESANNAAAQTSFIPLLTLGIPSNGVMALMLGAMTIHNIQPGPLVMTTSPGLFWGMIVSMWLGNLMLVILNLPLVGIWVKLLEVPYRFMFPAILLFACIGLFSVQNTVFDIYAAIVFAAIGYVFAKLRCETAPFLLGFILGPMMEDNLRRAMLLSRGDPTVFLTQPLSLAMLLLAVGLLLLVLLPQIRRTRKQAFEEA